MPELSRITNMSDHRGTRFNHGHTRARADVLSPIQGYLQGMRKTQNCAIREKGCGTVCVSGTMLRVPTWLPLGFHVMRRDCGASQSSQRLVRVPHWRPNLRTNLLPETTPWFPPISPPHLTQRISIPTCMILCQATLKRTEGEQNKTTENQAHKHTKKQYGDPPP